MYFRPSRIVAVKFLGLWGSNQVANNTDTQDKQLKASAYAAPITDRSVSRTSLSPQNAFDLSCQISESSKSINSLMLENGIPGLTICVSKKGKVLWEAGFGCCDVENQIPCEPDAKMRIASISKALFVATVIGPMIEANKIDLKTSIHKYLTLDEFPKQKFQDREYDLTVEQVLSHTAGIKHYVEADDDSKLRSIGSEGCLKVYQNDDQFSRNGFYQRQTFRDVIDALRVFRDGPLAKKPGEYSYTTFGYVLLSAIAQKIRQSDEENKREHIENHWMKTVRRNWNMSNTSLDQDEPILSKRARYYLRTRFNGRLINAPYQDSSIKWAGGGIISTAGDLIKFANGLIDAYKGKEDAKLKPDTVRLLWTEVKESYGLGFIVKEMPKNSDLPDKVAVGHTGGALGASSDLTILPDSEVAVAILTNMGIVNLWPLALDIAEKFSRIEM